MVRTVASEGSGAADLWDAVRAHRAHLEATGELVRRREARLRDELRLIVERRLRARAEALLAGSEHDRLDDDVARGRLDPWSAADRILAPLDDA